MKHKLVIRSLHDAQAECTCEEWHFSYTGAMTRKKIRREWMRHINRKGGISHEVHKEG